MEASNIKFKYDHYSSGARSILLIVKVFKKEEHSPLYKIHKNGIGSKWYTVVVKVEKPIHAPGACKESVIAKD